MATTYQHRDAEGNIISGTISDIATETTAAEMLKVLKQLVSADAKSQSNLQKLVDHAKEQSKNQEKQLEADEDVKKTLEKVADNTKTAADNAKDSEGGGGGTGKWAARGEKAFRGFYSATSFATKGLMGLGAIGVGVVSGIFDQFTNLGSTLNQMTTSGVAFTDGMASGGMNAIDAMSELSMSGIDAAQTMMAYSNVVQSMGKRNFVEMTQEFAAATASGAALGLSLEDSTKRLGKELQKRQLMGAFEGIDSQRQIQSINTTIKRQQVYATALGVSTDELESFTDTLISDTPALSAALLRFGPETRAGLVAGITDFGTAMRAMGGKAGGEIAMAFVEAGAKGSAGMSESMTGFLRAMPSLNKGMGEYIEAMRDGKLTQDQANAMAQDLANNLGNASEEERNRIFALARNGDQYAQTMADAIMQFDQSKKKIADINDTLDKGITMEGVQKGSNVLNTIISKLSGTFEALKMQFLQGIGSVESLTNLFDEGGEGAGALKYALDTISGALNSAFHSFTNVDGAVEGLSDGAEGLGRKFGEMLPGLIKKFADKLGAFIEAIPTWIDSVKNTWNRLKEGINSFLDWILGPETKDEAGEPTGKREGGVVDKVKEGWGEFAEKLKLGTTIFGGLLAAVLAVKTAMSVKNMFGGGGGVAESTSNKGIGSIGRSAGAGLTGLARGLKAVGSPQALLGLGGITLAIMGIGKALEYAAPAFEPIGKAIGNIVEKAGPTLIHMFTVIGDVIKTALGELGPIIKALGDGIQSVLEGISTVIDSIGGAISGVITSVADGIANVITAIKGDQEAMLKAQTDQIGAVNKGIMDLASIPNDNLFNTARGIDSIAEAMKSFADTVISRSGGVKGFFGEMLSGEKADLTDQFIASMNRFAAIDGEKIAFNAQAMINANRAVAGLTEPVSMQTTPTATPTTVQSTPVAAAQASATAETVQSNVESATVLPTSSNDTELLQLIVQELRLSNRLSRQGNNVTRDIAAGI